MGDDLVDQAPKQRLLLLAREAVGLPPLRDLSPGLREHPSRLWIELIKLHMIILHSLDRFLGLLQLTERCVPASLQLAGHEAVVRVGLLVVGRGGAGLVTERFELLRARRSELLPFLGERGIHPVVDVELRGRERLEEEMYDVIIDRVGAESLTDRAQ